MAESQLRLNDRYGKRKCDEIRYSLKTSFLYCIPTQVDYFYFFCNFFYSEPSTESDFLRQAISTSFSQKNNNARQGQNAELQRKKITYSNEGKLGASSSLTRIEQSTLVAPASPGQIRLAKESAAVKSLTLSRLQDKVLTISKLLKVIYKCNSAKIYTSPS